MESLGEGGSTASVVLRADDDGNGGFRNGKSFRNVDGDGSSDGERTKFDGDSRAPTACDHEACSFCCNPNPKFTFLARPGSAEAEENENEAEAEAEAEAEEAAFEAANPNCSLLCIFCTCEIKL
jgi:hypothetical protein